MTYILQDIEKTYPGLTTDLYDWFDDFFQTNGIAYDHYTVEQTLKPAGKTSKKTGGKLRNLQSDGIDDEDEPRNSDESTNGNSNENQLETNQNQNTEGGEDPLQEIPKTDQNIQGGGEDQISNEGNNENANNQQNGGFIDIDTTNQTMTDSSTTVDLTSHYEAYFEAVVQWVKQQIDMQLQVECPLCYQASQK